MLLAHKQLASQQQGARTIYTEGSHALPDFCSGRYFCLKSCQNGLTTLRCGGQKHSLRLDTTQARRLQVRDDNDGLSHERFGLVGFRYARHELTLLSADIYLQSHESIRPGDPLRLQNFGHAQVNPGELLNGHQFGSRIITTHFFIPS